MKLLSNKQDCFYVSIIFRIVGNLGLFSLYNLVFLCHKAQLTHIYLNDSAFGNYSQSCT